MGEVRLATLNDVSWLKGQDGKIERYELERVVGCERVLVFEDGSSLLGFLRWGLFWDEVPFMNLVLVLPDHRGIGIGRTLIQAWEDRCRTGGAHLVMTSTLANEDAQHLYRKLGYVDSGCLLLPDEALEIIFTKRLAERPEHPERHTAIEGPEAERSL